MSHPQAWNNGRSEIVTADIKEALRKPDWKSKFTTPRSIFTGVGIILLGLLSIVPIWNAVILLEDSNYVYWAGRAVPHGMIVGCVLIVLVYIITCSVFFRKSHSSVHTENTIMMIANIFITLFGLFLMTCSLPLSHQSELTYTNLLHRCVFSDQTHRLYEYSQVLQNIRADPKCAQKFSVEECEGYEQAAPYTNFLKGMENNFRCSGFCYQPPKAEKAVAPAPAAASPAPAKAASLLSTKQRGRQQHMATEGGDCPGCNPPIVQKSQQMAAIETEQVDISEVTYPPTLFSNMNFQASCEGMAARDMKNFAGAIGNQTFFQGVYFVFIAVITGFLKLMSFCHKAP